MKSAIFSNVLLFIFLQTIVPAQNTICYSCIGANSKTCEQKEVECPPHSKCMTISEEYKALGKVYKSLSKRCSMNLPCNQYMYGYADRELSIRISLKCCDEDRCNSGNYDMPDNHNKEQGNLCPSCHKYDSLDGCNATRSTVCWGKDDKCIKWRGTILRPDGVEYNVSAQGCSSANACLYDYSEAACTKVIDIKEYECYVPTAVPALGGKKP